jgi:peptidoglycan/xylan/chitin deacetylase (PgdA/CDA1 family)
MTQAWADGYEKRGGVPVAVTFDDGYEDVLHEALPALERFDVPATVFMVLDGLSGAFWWDRLQRVLEVDELLPDDLHVRVSSVDLQWSRRNGADALRDSLYHAFRSVDLERREELLSTLESWAVGGGGQLEPPPSALTKEQLCRLGEHPLVEIGSHSATHPELEGLADDSLEREITGSREHLQAILGGRVDSFSYPHGILTPRVRERVIAAGYLRACASWNGLVGSGVDSFRLPRLWPGGYGGEGFQRWLRSWTGR